MRHNIMYLEPRKSYVTSLKTINESFEDIYPSNAEIKLTTLISKDIIDLNDLSKQPTHKLIVSGKLLENVYVRCLRYEDINLPFMKNLNVFVVLKCGDEDEYMVLDDIYQYNYDEANDTFNKQKIDIQFVDVYSDVEEVLQVMKKDCYEEASLYFQFENKCNISQKKLMFILRHEFVHLKDALHRQLKQYKINISQQLTGSA